MIRIENLVKHFGKVAAVDGISFSAKNGAITGLLGHNGAGKSTCLRVLYGLLKADSGKVLLDEIDVLQQPLLAQQRIGVMTDAHGLYPRLTAREHIAYFARLRGMPEAKIAQRSQLLLTQLGMQDIADRRATGYSQGEKMKVCLARALVHDPQNIIMDEPTNGLDVMTTRSVRSILYELKAANKCVLLSSHIMQEVSALCDEVIVIAGGKALYQGGLEQLLAHTKESNLEDAFVNMTGAAV
ncbi:MAG: ATP-binding cassette domain-containing protein [Pseudohongiellaceae bacterium]|jgi:sodium transport system ATP-binding protein